MRRFTITTLAVLSSFGAARTPLAQGRGVQASPTKSSSASGQVPQPAGPAGDSGYRVDFQDADIRAVLTALATAGGLNLTYGGISPRKVSLRLNQPVSRAAIRSVLREVALSNGLRVSEDAGLITVSEGAEQTPAADGGGDAEFYTYRLRHANASRAAAVLQAMFAAGGLRGNPGQPQQGVGQNVGSRRRRGFGGGGGGGGVITGISLGAIGDGNGGGLVIQTDATATPSPQLGGNNAAQGPKGVLIVPDETTNSLLVRAEPQDWALIRRAIESVDLRPLQVVIEVMIAEVRRTDDLDIGVSGTSRGRRGRSLVNGRLGPVSGSVDSSSDGGFVARLTRTGGVDVDLTLRALQQRGTVRVLSLPLIFAQNNRQSTLVVGTQRPFVQTVRTLATDNTARDQVVEYKDVGTVLDLIPTINPDGYVNLQVYQEVSSATAEVQFGAPIISTRQATASLFVRDGQTVVVGGLTDRQEQNIRSGIPVLSSVPLIGGLFGSTRKVSERTELYLFLTPHVVATDADAEHVRREVGAHSELMHQIPADSVRVIDPQGPPPRDTTVAPRDPVERLSPGGTVRPQQRMVAPRSAVPWGAVPLGAVPVPPGGVVPKRVVPAPAPPTEPADTAAPFIMVMPGPGTSPQPSSEPRRNR